MSDKSWLEEYYPVKANKGSKENAINHSLNKWIGLLPENLKKHNLDSPPINIGGNTCALCYHYNNEDIYDDSPCELCPLYITRQNTPCDCYNSSLDNNKDSPYSYYHKNKDPQPMIDWLMKTKRNIHSLI